MLVLLIHGVIEAGGEINNPEGFKNRMVPTHPTFICRVVGHRISQPIHHFDAISISNARHKARKKLARGHVLECDHVSGRSCRRR